MKEPEYHLVPDCGYDDDNDSCYHSLRACSGPDDDLLNLVTSPTRQVYFYALSIDGETKEFWRDEVLKDFKQG